MGVNLENGVLLNCIKEFQMYPVHIGDDMKDILAQFLMHR